MYTKTNAVRQNSMFSVVIVTPESSPDMVVASINIMRQHLHMQPTFLDQDLCTEAEHVAQSLKTHNAVCIQCDRSPYSPINSNIQTWVSAPYTSTIPETNFISVSLMESSVYRSYILDHHCIALGVYVYKNLANPRESFTVQILNIEYEHPITPPL